MIYIKMEILPEIKIVNLGLVYKDNLINNNKITLFDKKGNPTKRITYTAKIKFN